MPGSIRCSTLRRPCEVKVAANSKAASWSASLMARRPSAGFIIRLAALTTLPRSPTMARSLSAMKAGRSSAVSSRPWSPAPNGFQPIAPIVWPGFRPLSARIWVREERAVARLRRQAEGLVEHALVRPGAELGVAPAFIADQQRRPLARHDDQQRLLEARIVAGEIGDVRGMLAVAIDGEAIEARGSAACEQLFDACLVGCKRDGRHHRRLAEFRQDDLPQGNGCDRHDFPS